MCIIRDKWEFSGDGKGGENRLGSGILLASSNVNQAVGNLAFTDVTGIKNKLAYQEHINRINERPDTFSIGMVMFDLNICMHTNRKVRKID